MKQNTPEGPRLPANQAFVVQFARRTGTESLVDTGRVEHVVSGQAAHFQSWDELQAFIAQVLAQVWARPP